MQDGKKTVLKGGFFQNLNETTDALDLVCSSHMGRLKLIESRKTEKVDKYDKAEFHKVYGKQYRKNVI